MGRCTSALTSHARSYTAPSAFDPLNDSPQSFNPSTSSAATCTCAPFSFARLSTRRKAPPCSSSPSPALPRSSPSKSPPSCLSRARLSRTTARGSPPRPSLTRPQESFRRGPFLQTDPVRSAPNRSGPYRSGPNRSALLRSGPQRSTPAQSAPLKNASSEPNRSEPNRSEPNRTGPNRTGSTESVRSGPVRFFFRLLRSAGAPPSLLPTNLLLSASAGAPVLNVDTVGQSLTYRSALAGPFRQQWIQSDDDELVKLVKGTGTLTPVHTSTSTPTYYNRVVKEKWTPSSLLRPGSSRSLLDDVDRRVRGTAGGDRLPSSCPPPALPQPTLLPSLPSTSP